MFSKKLSAVLVAVGVLSSTSALFSEINIKGAFADTIKQNVVYTKNDTSAVSKDDTKINSADEEAYKKKSMDIVKKYFNISVNENENFQFFLSLSNEKTLDALKLDEEKAAKESFDNKKISKEEYDKQIADAEEGNRALKDKVAKLKFGTVQVNGLGADKGYQVDFNENTKEVEFVIVSESTPKESDVKLIISEDKLKNTAEDFIKQNKLSDIEKPKCILVKGNQLFYQDENDASKKVMVGIDEYTGKVGMFALKEEAAWEYDSAINEK